MDDEQRRHAEELLRITQRRLQKLEEQAALKGSDTPPHILIEIEDARAEVARLQAALEQRSPSGETGLIPPHPTLSHASRRTNLPAPATALIGRTREVADVCTLLRRADVRLVTLKGPGGVGKTRLAIQVATELLDEYTQGVWFIDLAPITDTRLVLSTIAKILGVKETSGQPTLESLTRYLRDRHLILLLDNFEHVVDAVPLLAQLLAGASGLKLLVTSRDVLHMYGEHEVTVPPLGLPDLAGPDSPDQVLQSDAVRLFVDRAQAVRPDFTVSQANATAVTAICIRLDGLPLAIELAAARVKLFAPPALLARLDSRLKTLTGGARDLPTRQQTLRGALDWSYQLLDHGEQTLFARLSGFVGGCTIEAVEAVCNADCDSSTSSRQALPLDVVEGIVGLMEKSLLQQKADVDGEQRFVMLETVREYALEQLAASGEVEAIRRRHAEYYLTLAKQAEPHLYGRDQLLWLNRLEQEHDNLRAALRWAIELRETDHALRLSAALGWFWFVRGFEREGVQWLEAALAQSSPDQTHARAWALLFAGYLTGDYDDRGRAYIEEGLALFRTLGDKRGIERALFFLGLRVHRQGNTEQAQALFAEHVAVGQALGDPLSLADAMYSMKALAALRGDDRSLLELAAEHVALRRQVGEPQSLCWSLNDLGEIARLAGDDARAIAAYEEALALARELRNRNFATEWPNTTITPPPTLLPPSPPPL